MQREIKFRAWGNAKNKFLYGNIKDFQFASHLYDFGNKNISWDTETNWIINYNPNNPVMQFTGLLDKNGKEIYEGDIVKYKVDNPDVVLYENCRFTLSNSSSRFPMGDDMTEDVEIIGNIYENLELLK